MKSLYAWEKIVLASGATEKDLYAATEKMARDPAGAAAAISKTHGLGKVAAHLAALLSCLRVVRSVAYQREKEKVDDRGTCTKCGNTGMVSVPHLQGVSDGEWRPVGVARGGAAFYTMAVICSCPLGAWRLDHIGSDKQPMSLFTYQEANPHWEWQMQEHHRSERERVRVLAKLQPPSDTWSDVIDNLLKRCGIRLPAEGEDQA